MTRFKLLFLALSVLLFACGDDEDDNPTPGEMEPTIALSASSNLDDGICVGQSVDIVAELRTEATVGIKSLVVERNDGEQLVEQTTFSSTNVNYTLTYSPGITDLDLGTVELIFTLTDRNDQVATETISFQVLTEYAFTQEEMDPDPSWDLVSNVPLTMEDGSEVDIFLTTETEGCGIGCVNYRFTFTSKNDTRFYEVPEALKVSVSPFNDAVKQADVEAAISGVTPVAELVVFSEFAEDFDPNTGALNLFPLIIQLRGTDEYALIAKLSEPGKFLYRKRSADAGN